MNKTPWLAIPLVGTLIFAAWPADAKKQKSADSDPSASASASSTDSTASSSTAPAPTASTSSSAPAASPSAPPDPDSAAEFAGQSYDSIGVHYRHTILPSFMLNLFVWGGPSLVSIPSIGLEFDHRRDNFDTIFGVSYANWAMDPFPFHGKNEGDTSTELVKSNLWLLNFTVDFLWSAPIDRNFAFTYGMTTGLSLVFGDLRRVQATPASGAGTYQGYAPCIAAGNPTTAYCDSSNNHYPTGAAGDTNNWYTEKDWFGGGYRPDIYPTFGPEIGFRWKPMKQLVMRIEAGFNLFAGFIFGVSGDYGL
jgi:hypothetical protein